MIITFMGNDGSGKTTISKEVFEFFKQLGFDVLYKHEYEYVFLRILFKMIGKNTIEKSRNEMLIENKRSLRYLLWPVLVWMDLLLQYYYFKLFKRNTIILLDRYPYDHYQSFKHLGTLTSATEWLFLHFPKPDVCLLLTVDPNIAYERKKSTHTYPLEFYQKQTLSYRDLASKLLIPIVDTSGELRETIKTVIGMTLKNNKLLVKVIHKGIQNRIIFYTLTQYDLLNMDLFDTIRKHHQIRKEMCAKSIMNLRILLERSGIEKYSLIKTYDDYGFYGNDIDIILSSSGFKKLLQYTMENPDFQAIEMVRYRPTKDVGKADILIKQGLNIDVHNYVGWENIVFINFDQLNSFIRKGLMCNMDVQTLDTSMNSIIVAIHIFEKGYMTIEEYMFLRQYLNMSILRERFPQLASMLKYFFIELEKFLISSSPKFPVFISMQSLISGYSNIHNPKTLSKENSKLLTMILLQIFWRVRYALKGNLPFDVPY